MGFSNALALPLPPPLPQILAGTRLASGLQAVGKIAGFEDGIENGLVGGNSFTGDNVLARVNSGEAIFNKSQQDNLLKLGRGESINNNSNNSSNVELIDKIDQLIDEVAFAEKNFNIVNELNVTPSDLLEVTEQGERDEERLQ
jgi:hypothetical protein